MSFQTQPTTDPAEVLALATELRRKLHGGFRDQLVSSLYRQAEEIAREVVHPVRPGAGRWDERVDRLVTSPIYGLPIMLALLALMVWITVVGANYPSALIARLLFSVEEVGASAFDRLGAPWWITGLIWHGVYRGLAWVVSVMFPPMAIFFPLFTFLEDLGYVPRVAFNLDWLFRKAGGHGKQALTMAMGFGCNAAGVVSARIIDSPRERLVAILTNNFVPCNGRFPTLIMLATVFVAASFSPAFTSLIAAATVVGIVLLGVGFTFLTSWALTRTVLRGAPSVFTLELPPYRRPGLLRILYTSFIGRTLAVLLRAMMTAAPAGAVSWILANIQWNGVDLARRLAGALDPLGKALGLDGVILLAYVLAIPANEIVVPTMLMIYTGSGMMIQMEGWDQLRSLLVDQHGWTLLTAVNLMLFALLHNPCGTTILTIWKETGSKRWAAVGALLPLGIGFAVTFLVASVARAVGRL